MGKPFANSKRINSYSPARPAPYPRQSGSSSKMTSPLKMMHSPFSFQQQVHGIAGNGLTFPAMPSIIFSIRKSRLDSEIYTEGIVFYPFNFFMQELKIYEVRPAYIDYLSRYEKHIFHNKTNGAKSRKYIGIVLRVNGFDYFVPLSSFKEKHKKLSESVDFVKIGNYAVLNLNNMIPVPKTMFSLYNISAENDMHYKNLLNAELRMIKSKAQIILSNAKVIYEHKLKNGDKSKLGKRCNDFLNLERLCGEFVA